MATVLVMTYDLGFQFWLAEALAESGFSVIPAKNPAKARKLLVRFNCAIDVVILNRALVGAEVFIDSLRRSQGYLHVLSVAEVGDTESRAQWVRRVRKTLSASATA